MKPLLAAPLLAISITSSALNIFEPGQVATAAAFNENFAELESSISNATSFYDHNAKANGVGVKVANYQFGYYTLYYNQNDSITINHKGYPTTTSFYYESDDCSGQPFIKVNAEFENDTSGWVSPHISTSSSQPKYDGATLYQGIYSGLYYLHANSIGNTETCRGYSISTLAEKPKESNLDLDFPIILTEIGEPIQILEEIGEGSIIEKQNVYSDNALIGTTTSSQYPPSTYIRVKLNDYPTQTINLKRDGTYTSFTTTSAPNLTFYFTSSNCTGNAYAEYSTELNFWGNEPATTKYASNNGQTFIINPTVYKMSNGYRSKRNYLGSCSSSTGYGSTSSYQMAAQSTLPGPTPPIFGVITVEGWDGDIISDLVEAE